MVDFTKYHPSTHPIIKAEDDYNNIIDHALEKPYDFIIRYNSDTLKYEALYGRKSNFSRGRGRAKIF